MFGKKKPEVLVIGAGPVGLFAAIALARRDVRVQIVDKEWRTGAHSYALALHGASLELLEELGLRDRVLQSAYRVRSVGLYDAETRRAEIPLANGDDASALAVMPQDVLERVLEDALGELGVGVLWNHEVSELVPEEDHVAVTIDKMKKDSMGYAVAHTEWVIAKSTKCKVPFVIGADGHRSLVRRSLGIDFAEVGPPLHAAVFELKTDVDLGHEMRVVLGEQTTDVLWPLPDGQCRWSFQLADFQAPGSTRLKDRIALQLGGAQYPVLAEDQLRALLAERAPWFEGKVEEISWRIVVRFERRLATAFGKGRTWLAGDAGHMTGPVGMQSMNVGLREARDLAEIVAGVLCQGESADRLEDYGRQRTAEWKRLLGVERGLQPTDATDPWIRQNLDRLLPCIPASGAALAALVGQLGVEYRNDGMLE